MAGSFLLEFEFPEEAKRVLKRGVRRVENNFLLLEKWTPDSDCFKVEAKARKVWVRVAGLPLNLWNHRMFKRIGDCCGGLLAMNSDIENFTHLQWARLQVKVKGDDFPRLLQVVMGSSCYTIQLWWEVPPRLSVVVSVNLRNRTECVTTHVG